MGLPGISLIQCPVWSIDAPYIAMAALTGYLRARSGAVSVFDLSNDLYHAVDSDMKKYMEREYIQLWAMADGPAQRFIEQQGPLLDSYVERILALDHPVVGFSIFSSNRFVSLDMARRIKARDPKRLVVLGGPDAIREPDKLIASPAVDAVIQGEGEESLAAYLESLAGGTPGSPLPGVILKHQGEIIEGGGRDPIMDLDRLPYLDFSDLELKRYRYPAKLPILGSRGCVRKCVFCPDTSMWIRYRWMSGERIFREIEHQVAKLGVPNLNVEFCDLLINGNMKVLSDFVDRMLERRRNPGQGVDLSRVTWDGQAIVRPEMTREFLDKMKAAGCLHVQYGIESGSQRILNLMKKNYKVEVADRVLRDTKASGIRTLANFMFGFPGEEEKDHQLTLEFLRRNRDHFDELNPSEALTAINPAAYLYQHAEEFGVATPVKDDLRWETRDGKNTFETRARRYREFCDLAVALKIPLSADPEKIVSELFSRFS